MFQSYLMSYFLCVQSNNKFNNNIIYQDLNHWVQGWVEWNLALDKTGGPTWVSNFIDSPIIIDKTADEFYKQPTFYAIGHFSKFISRGSVRIKLTQSSVIKSVGFKRPDGAVVIVLYNRYNERSAIFIYCRNIVFNLLSLLFSFSFLEETNHSPLPLKIPNEALSVSFYKNNR